MGDEGASLMIVDENYLTSTKQFIIYLVRMECVRTHVVHARADIVATKLGIILSSSFFLLSFFFPSTYFSPRRGLPMSAKFMFQVTWVTG